MKGREKSNWNKCKKKWAKKFFKVHSLSLMFCEQQRIQRNVNILLVSFKVNWNNLETIAIIICLFTTPNDRSALTKYICIHINNQH